MLAETPKRETKYCKVEGCNRPGMAAGRGKQRNICSHHRNVFRKKKKMKRDDEIRNSI